MVFLGGKRAVRMVLKGGSLVKRVGIQIDVKLFRIGSSWTFGVHFFERRSGGSSDPLLLHKLPKRDLEIEKVILVVMDDVFEKFVIFFD